MKFSSTYLSISSLFIGYSFAATSANPDSSEGTILYVNSPACGSFQCVVDWTQGSKVNVNWINPPSGDVSIALASNIGGAVYPIVSKTPATSTTCDSGNGLGVPVSGVACGGVQFLVPGGWVPAVNYTIVVTSLDNPSIVGYTDAITIVAGNNAPSGITVTLLTGTSSSTSGGNSSGGAGSSPVSTGGAVPGSKSTSAVVPTSLASPNAMTTLPRSGSISPTATNGTRVTAPSSTSTNTSGTISSMVIEKSLLISGIVVGLSLLVIM